MLENETPAPSTGEGASRPIDGRELRRELMGDEAVDRYLSGPAHAAAPQLTKLIDQRLFGEIWQAGSLNCRERALVTVAALSAAGLHPQLRSYVRVAQRLGIEREVVIQVIVQLAFYIGFPSAGSAISIVVEVYEDASSK